MSTPRSQNYKRKNVLGSRSDIGWKHGTEHDKSQKKVQCNYCKWIISGGIHRFKHHLACTHENTEPCTSVPDEVRGEMKMALENSKKQKSIVQFTDDSEGDGEEFNNSNRSKVDKRSNIANKDSSSSSKSIDLRHEACQQIARFFYKNGIPFDRVRTPEFTKMFELVANFGHGFKPSSYNEISKTFLRKEVKDTLDLHIARWKKLGCSIMLDIREADNTSLLFNIWINCSEGTIFFASSKFDGDFSSIDDEIIRTLDSARNKVGEENVVQVIYRDPRLKKIEEAMLGNRKRMFWTPCAAFSIESILNKFVTCHDENNSDEDQNDGNIISNAMKIASFIYSRVDLISMLRNFTDGEDLIRSSINTCVTSFWTINHLYRLRRAFMAMVTSYQWDNIQNPTRREGRFVQKLILDLEFWGKVRVYLWVASPLIAVHQRINYDDKPTMGFIYEAMNRAKKKILQNMKIWGNNQNEFRFIKKIFDEMWDMQFCQPLHLVAYYLNPYSHDSGYFPYNDKIKNGLDDCLNRMIIDEKERETIQSQVNNFMLNEQILSRSSEEREKQTPYQWWEDNGNEYPELQRFAIQILSLTCSFVYNCNQDSTHKMVAKPINDLRQRNIYKFVMQNLSSKRNALQKGTMYDLPLDDERILEDDNDYLAFYNNILGDFALLRDEYDKLETDGDQKGDEDFDVSNEMEIDDSNGTGGEEN